MWPLAGPHHEMRLSGRLSFSWFPFRNLDSTWRCGDSRRWQRNNELEHSVFKGRLDLGGVVSYGQRYRAHKISIRPFGPVPVVILLLLLAFAFARNRETFFIDGHRDLFLLQPRKLETRDQTALRFYDLERRDPFELFKHRSRSHKRCPSLFEEAIEVAKHSADECPRLNPDQLFVRQHGTPPSS